MGQTLQSLNGRSFFWKWSSRRAKKMPSRKEFYLFSQKRKRVITIGSIEYVMLCKSHVRSGFENPFFQRISLKSILGILSTNNPVSKVLSLRPSAQGPRPRALGPGPSAQALGQSYKYIFSAEHLSHFWDA